MPSDVGYEMEIATDSNAFEIGKLERGDDRVSPAPAPTFKVDLDFEEMLKGVAGDSEPMALKDGAAKKSRRKAY